MTQRERHASGSVSAVAAAPTALAGGAAHAAPRAVHGADRAGSRVMLWEEFYRSITPAQQDELLALAGRQGLLYAHQLPVSSNGSRAASEPLAGAQRILSHIFDEHGKGLDPVHASPATVRDSALDATQCEAVARALSTPDFCLIQGLPGTGKSRVAAEIIVQAAIRRQRVLLLSPSPAALDRTLEMIADCEAVCPVRCLGADEKAEELPSSIRGFVFAEQARSLREQSVLCARQGRERAEQTCRRRQQESGLWSRLLELSECWQHVEEQHALLRDQCERTPDQVRQEATADKEWPADRPFGTALNAWRKARQDTLAEIDTALDSAQRARTECNETAKALEAQAEPLRELAAARQEGRWWSPKRWRALFKGDIAGKLAAIECQLEDARAELGQRALETQRLATERSMAEQAAQTKWTQLVECETQTRLDMLIAQEQALIQEAALLQSKWDNLCQALEPPDRPTARSPAAVQAAERTWQRHVGQDEERCTFARQWSAYLDHAAADVAIRLPDYANLVAATTGSLATDPHFGDAATARQTFDLLILEEATHVTESEFLQVARRAARWVLIGQPAIEGEGVALPPKAVKAARSGSPVAPGLGALRPGFFQRLWQHLHADPSRLPCGWFQEGERVCCRLRSVAADQRRWVESERVADFPDIELRILTLPRLQPVLAEVIFPATMSIHEAKQYLYRELQEFPVQTTGRSLNWVEEPGQLTLRLSRTPAVDARPVQLENGVKEWVGRATSHGSGDGRSMAIWQTCRIEFDRSAGWERGSAESWVRDHLQMCDLGRTALLESPHRMTPTLAAVVWDVLFEEYISGQAATSTPAVEFVAVPPAGAGTKSDGRGARDKSFPGNSHPSPLVYRPSRNLPQTGAGLELDLAAPRHGDRLPSELRGRLPRQGFVNYLEAQAIVRRLETLAAKGVQFSGGIIAVIALYPAQVELIRHLLQQSTVLNKAGLPIAVDLPGAFTQRECHTVLVSLTRSPAHRAASFGDGPRALTLALTRARQRLLLFGDPGACVCRSQWRGPLDHLDDGTAAREAQIFARIVGYLQGQGRQQRAFHRSEGSST